MINRLIHLCLHQKLVVLLLLTFVILWGLRVAPFDGDAGPLPRDPVAVDAIPDLGDNQQIIYTDWPGRSPRDVEDQVTYPLTVSLLGVPGVREVRSFSMFGSSYIYLIFEEDIEFYWSRARILEKLGSLPAGLLPEGAAPSLGPDATALGQVFWYYLAGRDPDGRPAGGWDADELRAVQDWQVRYALLAAEGVAEVASVGGFERQYQVDVDPDALRAHDLTMAQVANAVRRANQEVGARNLVVNGVEYFVRATGYVTSEDDLLKAVVAERDGVPLTVGQVATVEFGPAPRRGALDVDGAEAGGGVVVARHGANPREVIDNVRQRIDAVAPSLPARAVIDWTAVAVDDVEAFASREGIAPVWQDGGGLPAQDPWMDWMRAHERDQWPDWLTRSQVTVVPFYDRSQLIAETLHTLNQALLQQVLVTVIVVIVMVMHLRTSLLISSMLPLAVLVTFIMMKQVGIDANIVALAGIAISIGTVVDVGIVLTENTLKHLAEARPGESRAAVIYRAVTEVAGAVSTALATTVISFLPVFTMTGEAGRLFQPLAYTKTFVLLASIGLALTVIPPLAHLFFGILPRWWTDRRAWMSALLGVAALIALSWAWQLALALMVLAAGVRLAGALPAGDLVRRRLMTAVNALAALVVSWWLAADWMPLGLGEGEWRNWLLVAVVIGGLLLAFKLFERAYEPVLRWCLAHKLLFLSAPCAMILAALCVWQGFAVVFGWLPPVAGERLTGSRMWHAADRAMPGLGREFRPSLDEGSFLFMPTISTHGGIDEAVEALRRLDAAIAAIPEVSQVVGKIGRAESALDPAPISMIETVVNYLPEYKSDQRGRVLRFQVDRDGSFVRDGQGELVPDRRGRPYRQWRPEIRSPDDIWHEIDRVTRLTGVTGAPKLQPIETRLVMLRTGMRAPMGIKVKGPDLETIEDFGVQVEQLLREGEVPGLAVGSVNADRLVGKPYVEIHPDRAAAARYGLNVADLHEAVQQALAGEMTGMAIEGRERFAIRVRYARERRDAIEDIRRLLVAAGEGRQLPLGQLADVELVQGPQMIRSEDTFPTGYITFGAESGHAEVDVVEAARGMLEQWEDEGRLRRPEGVRYEFAGNYQAALEFTRTLAVMLPMCLAAIFLLLYLNSRSAVTAAIIFSGVVVAWSGGFILLGFYNWPGFLDFHLFGHHVGGLLNVGPINLSTAVWVGFLALFGIATDDGVVMSTYLRQRFEADPPDTVERIRQATVEAGLRRVRPCLMTSATTMLALLPVMTSTGRGSDLMAPMAVPIFGGMLVVLLSMFMVPVLFAATREFRVRRGPASGAPADAR